MRRLKITHRTYYNFPDSVQLGPHRLLLRPREGHQLHIESSSLDISPPAQCRWLRDVYDNSVAIASFDSRTIQLAITSEVIVHQFDEAPLDFMVEEGAVNFPFNYDSSEYSTLRPYLSPQFPDETNELRVWLEKFWRPAESIQSYTLLQRLCTGIHETFRYQIREEPGVQRATETVRRGTGSCRDFANLFMEAARLLGLATRFVSGYLHAPASASNFGATHAWAEVYLPGAGWKGFDPTLGEIVGSKHIAVAVACLPESVAPVSGSYLGPSGASLHVGVWVSEL